MQRFKNILVVGSEGPAFEYLVGRAADLARRNEADMTILGVVKSSHSDRRVVLHDGTEFDLNRFLVQTMRAELQGIADTVEGVDVTVAVAVFVGDSLSPRPSRGATSISPCTATSSTILTIIVQSDPLFKIVSTKVERNLDALVRAAPDSQRSRYQNPVAARKLHSL